MTEKSNIMIRVDAELLAWLENEATRTGVSRNTLAVLKLKEASQKK